MNPVGFAIPQNNALIPLYQAPPNLFYNANSTICRKEDSPNYYQEVAWKTKKIEPVTFDAEGPAADMVRDKMLRIEAGSFSSGVNQAPILYDDTTNKPIAIFKGHNSWFSTTSHGDIVAYHLDHDSYAKVPPAFNVTSLPQSFPQREKFLGGTFVSWVPNSRGATLGELLTGDIEQRQAIAILDIRLGNRDRTASNIIVDEHGNLIPVDHDSILTTYWRPYLPKTIACYNLEPFTATARHYIENLDIQKDVEITRKLGVSENEIANLVIRTVFLKLAAEADITVGRLEALVQKMALPTGSFGKMCEKWLYSHELRKILSNFSEPFDEEQLKEAFRENFKFMLYKTEQLLQFDYWDIVPFLEGPLKVVKIAMCWLYNSEKIAK